jgi:preprotein translocase subunit YajC
MLISPAYAQAGGAPAGGDFFVSLMPLVLIFVVFYFLLIRPQQQKVKLHRQMVEGLKRGDQVVTAGGILGRVTRVDAGDATLTVEIAPNVQVKVARHTISEVVGKPQPATNDNRAGQATAAGAGGGESVAQRLSRLFKR